MVMRSNGGGKALAPVPAASVSSVSVSCTSTEARAAAEAEEASMDVEEDDDGGGAGAPTAVDGGGGGAEAEAAAENEDDEDDSAAAALALSLVGRRAAPAAAAATAGGATVGRNGVVVSATGEGGGGGRAAADDGGGTAAGGSAVDVGGGGDASAEGRGGATTAVGALRRRWLSRRRRRGGDGAAAAAAAAPTCGRGRVAAVSDPDPGGAVPAATGNADGPPSRKRARPAGTTAERSARDDGVEPAPVGETTETKTTGMTVEEIGRAQLERLRAVEARLLRERLRVETGRRTSLEGELSKVRRNLSSETRRRKRVESDLAAARGSLANRDGDDAWGDNLGRLLLYRAEHGDCMVPNKHEGGRVGSLAHWVRTLRRWRRERESAGAGAGDAGDDAAKEGGAAGGGGGCLTDERIRVLDSIGFAWRVGGQGTPAERARFWERNFSELAEFRARHGHCNATQKTRLGGWVKSQRERYKETRRRLEYVEENGTDVGFRSKFQHSCMTKDQIDRLNAFGFEWTLMPPNLGWDAQFEELMEYKKQHGHTRVPQSYHGRRRLGRWVSRQRELYWDRSRTKKKYCYTITDERVAKLEGIGFLWRPSGEKKDGNEASVQAAVPTLPPYGEEPL